MGWGATMLAAVSTVMPGFEKWVRSLPPLPVWHDFAGLNSPGWAFKELAIRIEDIGMAEWALGPMKFLFRNFRPTTFWNNVFTRDPNSPQPRPRCRAGAHQHIQQAHIELNNRYNKQLNNRPNKQMN